MDLNLHKSTVTRMYYVLGYDVKTISQKTSIPVNSVKILIQKKEYSPVLIQGKKIPYHNEEEAYASSYPFDELKKITFDEIKNELPLK